MLAALVGVAAVSGLASSVEAAAALPPHDDHVAFEMLKSLEGRWKGTSSAMEGETVVVYEVVSGGSVVLERLHEGSEHEMISMYHLDGADLVMTHYCSAGNQPQMRLVRATENEMELSYSGGFNVDPAIDGHIHAVSIALGEDGSLKSTWTWYENGEAAHPNEITLWRQR